ncbi:hypothetical protein EYF80_035269 [Liparis tanakae]|uniref:Uncharacterized protein n=1 Tax=Liparis tanakae TaxID=230148 RepID=A0A4Z2GP12_9TELE|nr:hypothetical protein EYF80_035269 [Liparis tanakae]
MHDLGSRGAAALVSRSLSFVDTHANTFAQIHFEAKMLTPVYVTAFADFNLFSLFTPPET